MATVKLPDGSKREIADGSTVMQLAESIGKGLAKAAVVGKVHVDVGGRRALGVEEALKREFVLQRVDVGDAGHVGHQRAGDRAADSG